MSNFKSIFANIATDFEKYDSAGLINEEKAYQDAIRALKRFGNDMAIIFDEVVDIKAGRGALPENFHSLLLAYKCEADSYTVTGNREELIHSIIFTERVANTSTWSECNSCCDESTESIIRENVYLNLDNKVTFSYKNPQLLRLTRNTVSKNKCQSNCQNLFVSAKSMPHEMRIEGNEIHTNFETGHIFLKFYGLPMNEDGEVDIPITANERLEEYIELHLQRKVIERLLINNDAQAGLANLYQVIVQQERIALRNASNNLKMSILTPHALKGLRTRGRLETRQYEVLTPASW